MFGFSTFFLLVPLFSFSPASAVQGGTATITGPDGFCPDVGHVNYTAWLGNQQNRETWHPVHWPALQVHWLALRPLAGTAGGLSSLDSPADPPQDAAKDCGDHYKKQGLYATRDFERLLGSLRV